LPLDRQGAEAADCAETVELVKALTRRGPELFDVEVLHMATMGIADYTLVTPSREKKGNKLPVSRVSG
jgi:hypothetical protein